MSHSVIIFPKRQFELGDSKILNKIIVKLVVVIFFNMPEPKHRDPSSKVFAFCTYVHRQFLENKTFLDNTQVLNSINSNDSAKMNSLANEFIRTFWKSVNLYGNSILINWFGWGTKDPITHIIRDNKGWSTLFHLDLDRYEGINVNCLVTLQLALWSCVSDKCFRLITATLLNSRVNVKVDDEISWSWMENLVKCVTLASTSVYHSYATDLQKKFPVAKCYYWPSPSRTSPPLL
jgi:hypothetical protein